VKFPGSTHPYVKVKGQWKYLYRAVDRQGNTVDFLLCVHRDKAAARRYFEKAIDQNGEPGTITVDKSGANLAALEALNAERSTPIKVRQNKYLNNIVEQDHRAIKRIIKPMIGLEMSPEVHAAANSMREQLGSALQLLAAELYASETHFLLELIQNADDNSYPSEVVPTIEIGLTNGQLVFLTMSLVSRSKMSGRCAAWGRAQKRKIRKAASSAKKASVSSRFFRCRRSPKFIRTGSTSVLTSRTLASFSDTLSRTGSCLIDASAATERSPATDQTPNDS
jgi:hypothetical protein